MGRAPWAAGDTSVTLPVTLPAGSRGCRIPSTGCAPGPLPTYLAAGWQQRALGGQLALALGPATIQLDEAAALLVTRVPAVCGDRGDSVRLPELAGAGGQQGDNGKGWDQPEGFQRWSRHMALITHVALITHMALKCHQTSGSPCQLCSRELSPAAKARPVHRERILHLPPSGNCFVLDRCPTI